MFSQLARGITLAAALGAPAHAQPEHARPLPNAHAHNDYLHARPLLGALELGVGSVEADVHLVGGRLLVAHSRDSVDATRTLESLYLDPLRAWTRAHQGRAFSGAGPLTLLIDVKSDSLATYAAIDAALRAYPDLFVHFDGEQTTEGPVLAIISGNRAIGATSHAVTRYAALDGRIADLARAPAASPALMPLVSDSWERITKWDGAGAAPANVRPALERVVTLAHARGQRVRFWGTPDTPAVWTLLRDAGVDLIGADDLRALAAFLGDDARDIRAARAAQNAAIARGDVDSIATFWTDDVEIRRGLGVLVTGRDNYRAMFVGQGSAGNDIIYQRLPDAVTASAHWPLGYEEGRWEGHRARVDGPVVIGGRYAAQWVKRAGRWLIRGEVYVALTCDGVGCESRAIP